MPGNIKKDENIAGIRFFSFDFQKPLLGEIFLEDYIIYIKKNRSIFFRSNYERIFC